MDKNTSKKTINKKTTKKSSSISAPKKNDNKVAKKTIKRNSNTRKNQISTKKKIINNNEYIREKKYNKYEKQEEINKSRKKTKIIILTIVIIVAFIIIGVVYYLLNSSTFNITNIIIKGNSVIAEEEILLKSGINIGDNAVKSLFNINKNEVVSTPYISSVKPQIKFPSTFMLIINERVSVYFAYDKEKNLYFKLDKYGIILESSDKIELKTNELLVYGITFDDEAKLGSKINDIDYSKLQIYTEIEEECKNVFPDKKITKVNFENSLTKIHLDDKIEVILPNNTELKYNLNFLKEILKNEGDVKGTIDMTKEKPTLIKL